MKTLNEILAGKSSEEVKKSQWDHYYNLVIPNGDWQLIYLEETIKKATQIYQHKDCSSMVIMFEFSGDYQEKIAITKWYNRGGYNMTNEKLMNFNYENEDGVGININPELIACVKRLYEYINGNKEKMNELRDLCVNDIPNIIVTNSKNASEIISRHFEIAMEEYEKEV